MSKPAGKPKSKPMSAHRTSGLRPPWKPGQSGNPAGRPKNEDRRKRFVAAYITNGYWGARAARTAGCPFPSSRKAACLMKQEPWVRAQIDAHLKAIDEAIARREAAEAARSEALAARYSLRSVRITVRRRRQRLR
jgi:hypothetical protein